MTFCRGRDSVFWSVVVILNRLLLIPAESVETTSYLIQPRDESRKPEGLSTSRKDFLVRYLASYPGEELIGPPHTHYSTYGVASDGDFSFLRPEKRLGSEFLGKRFISYPDMDAFREFAMEKRKLGSEFLGKKRRLGSEFLGKRSDPLERFAADRSDDYHYKISPLHAVVADGRLWLPIEVDGVLPGIHRPPKRSLGSEFLGKRALPFDATFPYTFQPQNFRLRRSVSEPGKPSIGSAERMGSELLGKRMGSEFLGKRMGSEFLGKRMGSEFLGKRMGSEFLGKRMGSEFLGKRMGSEFLGKRMGSEFLGKRMGSEFLGKRMGSEFLGKRMGSEFLGKRMGSEFLGKRRLGPEFLRKLRMGSEYLANRKIGSEFLGKRGGVGSDLFGKREESSAEMEGLEGESSSQPFEKET